MIVILSDFFLICDSNFIVFTDSARICFKLLFKDNVVVEKSESSTWNKWLSRKIVLYNQFEFSPSWNSLAKCYKVTNSKFSDFATSHVTISRLWTAVLPLWYSLKLVFWWINSPKIENPCNRYSISNWTKVEKSVIQNIEFLLLVTRSF